MPAGESFLSFFVLEGGFGADASLSKEQGGGRAEWARGVYDLRAVSGVY